MSKQIFTFLFALCLSFQVFAQQSPNLSKATSYIQGKATNLNLSPRDVADFHVSHSFTSSHNNVEHFYLMQDVNGIPVFNGTFSVHLKEGRPFHYTENSVKDIYKKANSSKPSFSAEEAVYAAAKALGQANVERLTTIKQEGNSFRFKPTSYSTSEILADLYYFEIENQVKLIWKVDLDIPGSDYFTLRMDAHTNELLSKHNYTVYCSFHDSEDHTHNHQCDVAKHEKNTKKVFTPVQIPATYRVYNPPIESPVHGENSLVVGAADSDASPYGWHDTDGEEGAEHTITKGNNVHAYLDKGNVNMSTGGEPDGTEALVFDFAHDQLGEPVESEAAAQVNLFYMVNWIHDFSYKFGFDEKSGNFQSNNYGKGGIGFDYVEAHSADGSGTNNANFATPQDGGNGVMQMYLWGANPDEILSITEPSSIAGKYVATGAQFGDNVSDTPVTAEVAIINDGTPNPTQGCSPAVNGEDLDGKIVLIERGACDFDLKCFNAEQAGAVAALVCNIPGVNGGTGEETLAMSSDDNPSVSILSVFTQHSTCNKIKASIQAGIPVSLTIQKPQITGPQQLDASYDNGVIAHEFGHGISNRLVGGANNTSCLSNDEQMGEGWSDFFTLVTTVEEGDKGDDIRGIGAYVASKSVANGGGIRDYPYSVDMSQSPKTYKDIIGTSAPHPLGEVWAAALWDLYWAMVDEYGYDADLTNTESGNFKAIQLVMDGMKMTQCSPGFASGRDGILAADEATYNGENKCLIWKVFARRGIGYLADEGSTNDRNDLTENFEALPTCIEELKISKVSEGFSEIGGIVKPKITVTNHNPSTQNNVLVKETLPNGLTYVDGSSTVDVAVDGNTLTWNLGNMEYLDEITFEYELKSDESNFSKGYFKDEMENGDDNWDIYTNPNEGSSAYWDIQEDDGFSGSASYYIENVAEETDNSLRLFNAYKLIGDKPALKFRHKYNTEGSSDGGFVAIREEGQAGWTIIDNSKALRNGYNSDIQYGTFAIPSLQGFSGDSGEEWIDSYFDLSEWAGKLVHVEFRFGTDANDAPDNGKKTGWSIDDVEFIDAFKYDINTCVKSDESNNKCLNDEIYVDSKLTVNNKEVEQDDYSLIVSPNPADKYIDLDLTSNTSSNAEITIFSIDGKMLIQTNKTLHTGSNHITIDIENLIPGMYTVQVKSGTNYSIKKFVK